MSSNELDLLKMQAQQLGISYKGNIGVESLRARIKAKLEGTEEEGGEEEEADTASENQAPAAPTGKKLTACVAKVIADHHAASVRGETIGVAAVAGGDQHGEHGCC